MGDKTDVKRAGCYTGEYTRGGDNNRRMSAPTGSVPGLLPVLTGTPHLTP